MSRTWTRMLTRLFRKPTTRAAVRRPRLNVEQVEARVVPATIITIQEAPGTLDAFLSATDGTILTTDNPGAAGSVSRAALQGVGAGVNIVILAEDAIIVDDLTAGPLALQPGTGNSATFAANSTSITFNDRTDSITTAGGDVFLVATTSAALGGLATGGGDITINADDQDIQAAINAGTGIVTLRTTTSVRDINLGTETAGQLSLTDVELDFITASVLRIDAANIGDISITAAITLANASVPTLSLTTGDTISETAAGSLVVANLQASGDDGVTLDNAANVSRRWRAPPPTPRRVSLTTMRTN